MSPNKILIFSLSYHPMIGGAELAIKEITDRIPNIEFDMVTLRFNKSHPKFERIGNVNVYRLGGSLGYLSKILFVPQAALFARLRKYDLHWSMMTYMLFPAVLAGRVPYVLTLQDGDPVERVFNRWFILPFRPLIFYGFKNAKHIQAISRFLAEWSRRKDAIIIPNGVDINKFSISNFQFPKNPNEITLITTSRLVEKNAVGDVIDALRFLPENIKFNILGIGPLEKELKTKADRLGLSKRVNFLGHIQYEDVPQYLHSADIFIRPSLSEGMGSSFIEAMVAGLPVIATSVGGIPDFLKDEETGLYCEVRNPESIAKQVQRLIKDESLRQKLVKNGIKLAKDKYDWSLIAQEMKTRVFDKV